MRIVKSNSLLVAESILALLLTRAVSIRQTDGNEPLYVIETFCNGREQGYAIIKSDIKNPINVCFSEARGSDDIMIRWSKAPLSPRGNIPDFGNYEYSTKTFPYNKQYEAMEFIYSLLTEETT